MYKAIIRKSAEAVITLFIATLFIFVLMRLAPGDPIAILLNQTSEVAMSDSGSYREKTAELRAELGLDRNVFAQYARWMERLLHFDLGVSIHTGRHVGAEIAARLPATVLLAVSALLIKIVLGLLFGIISARKAGRPVDGLIRFVCVAVASTPAFVVGLFLLSLFAVTWDVYEIGSGASLTKVWLPAVTLGLLGAPQLIRVVRANMLSELGQTYVLSALSRGLSKRLAAKHAWRNALLPVITMIGLSLASLLGGAVVIETIFSWPGIGKYALDSILLKDYPVIQGYALLSVSMVVLVNLSVDVVYALADPRIRNKGETGVE
ncbi:ABC transporter permease [Paenibacillus mesophilus]|uniref:ABC transporter permease n=1 Tax=Paenibacillus mesophilus TaxID=2582849 RepID=UPI00110F2AC1|nr:ABC transporter permease [Paenibacillus mesophilus]TMV47825.1 ABC transporter permease [Paenibacillus mesophilus]